jgi:hypothetical protein
MQQLTIAIRLGVIALYVDGASYGAAQFGWQDVEGVVDSPGVSWIEREIATIKRSYEEEIRILETETTELRSKVRQSNSYIGELRKRFEESMKAMYRPGKDQVHLTTSYRVLC